MDTCICMAESLCCPPEIITMLLIGYTAIQNKKVKKKKKKPRAWEPQRLFTNTGPGGVIIAATEALLISIRAVLVAPLSRVQSIFR